jgi:phosphatidylserine synthase
VTLIAACLFAFRILYLWLEYLHFWVNASAEVVVFGVCLLAHLILRPRDDPQFRKNAWRIVIGTLVVMGLFLLIAFNLRIA